MFIGYVLPSVSLYCSRYEAGDHVGIYPANDIEIVNSIGERLGIDLDIVISLKNVDGLFTLLLVSYCWRCNQWHLSACCVSQFYF